MNVPVDGYLPLDPDGPTGRRLVDLIGRDVFDLFDRTNVLDRKIWSRQEAKRRADDVMSMMSGRDVMVFGNETWLVLSLPRCLWLDHVATVSGIRSTTWYRVPHPSGRNRWYNEPSRRVMVRELFERVAHGGS